MEDSKRCRILAISGFDWKSNIRNRLDLGGYTGDELRFASSGLQAIADAEKDPPDLIIYSLSTHDLDGYEFCRKLKWTPALQDVPVLLVGWVSPTIVYPRGKACRRCRLPVQRRPFARPGGGPQCAVARRDLLPIAAL